jgi:hypothetical protein
MRHREISLFVGFCEKRQTAVQEGHSLGDSTPVVLRVKAWNMMEEQDMTQLDEVVFVSIAHRGMA